MTTQASAACKKAVVDVPTSGINLVFKEAFLAILPRSYASLSDEEFEHIVVFAAEIMREKTIPNIQLEIRNPESCIVTPNSGLYE